MTRRKRLKFGVAIVPVAFFVMAATVSSASAALWLGWADEFLVGHFHCRLSARSCTAANHWAGTFWAQSNLSDPAAHPTWSYVGRQTGNATGRANAKAKVMFTFRDDDNFGVSLSVTISRKRTGAPPGEGSTCDTSSGVTFVGSVTQTLESTSIPATDWKYNNRLLPVMDFSLESWSGGMTIGYADTLSGVQSCPGCTMTMGTPLPGCYKIQRD